MSALTVTSIAHAAGVSPHTIRYYERLRLLPVPARSDSGYRLYDPALVDRLRFIRGAKRVGLRLQEIGELLDIMDRGQCPAGIPTRSCVYDSPKSGTKSPSSPACVTSCNDYSRYTHPVPVLTAPPTRGGAETTSPRGGDTHEA